MRRWRRQRRCSGDGALTEAGWPEGVGRVVLDRVDSTNAEAARCAAAGERGPLWILAHRQTAGRGRLGRSWASPEGNLAATLLFDPQLPPAEAAQLSFVACLAVAELLSALAPGARASLKWPNDPLLNGRKTAGVLIDSAGSGGRLDWMAIGIGVNLATAPGPESLRPGGTPATSVVAEGGRPTPPETALAGLAAAMARWQGIHAAEGFAPIRAAWLARAEGLGRPVAASAGSETLRGTFEDMDDMGRLVLWDGAQRRRLAAADLTLGE